MEIDYEIISTVILLPSAGQRRVVVSYKRKYVHEVLVNRLAKFAQEKNVVRWTDSLDMAIAVDWNVKKETDINNISPDLGSNSLTIIWHKTHPKLLSPGC